MMYSFWNGIGSVIIRVKLRDTTLTNNGGKTGLTSSSSGLIISIIADNEATATTYTVAASHVQTITTLGTFAAPSASNCRFKEVDATNHPGLYEIQIANARWAVSGARFVNVTVSGVSGVTQEDGIIQLPGINAVDNTNSATPALPNAAAAASGGLPTFGTGAGQINVDGAGNVKADVQKWLAGTIPAVTVTGVPLVDLKYTLGTLSPAAAGSVAIDWAQVSNKTATVALTNTTVGTVTTYTGNTPQTGDSFARLGAPAGASIAADLAEIEAETDTLLTQATTPPTAAAIATTIWQDLLAGADFGTPGSIGALLKLDIDAAISSRSTYAGGDTSGTTTLLGRLTAGRATNLDNLDVAVSSRLATSGYTTPPTAIAISSTLLDTVNTAAAHNVANSVGKQLRTAGGRTTVIRNGTARAGSTSTTIVLDAGASAVNNAYQWDVVSITGGTGAGQSSLITSYAGGTQTATVEDAWSPTPDTTSTFEITPTTDTRVVNYGVGQDPATLVLDVAAASHNIVATIGADINNAAAGGGGDTPGTTTLLSRLTSGRATNLDNLDATVSSRSIYAGGDTAGTSTLLTRLTALRAGYLDNLSVGPVATHADATALDSDVLSRASATVAPSWYAAPVDVSANVAAIKAKTDQLTFTGGNVNAVTAGDSPGVTTLLSRIGGPITIGGGMVAVDQSGIADALLKRDWTALSGEASSSMLNALRKLRNKWSLVVTPGSLVVYKEDGNSIAYTELVTTTASAQPITSMG